MIKLNSMYKILIGKLIYKGITFSIYENNNRTHIKGNNWSLTVNLESNSASFINYHNGTLSICRSLNDILNCIDKVENHGNV